jgi:hypothetical protein
VAGGQGAKARRHAIDGDWPRGQGFDGAPGLGHGGHGRGAETYLDTTASDGDDVGLSGPTGAQLDQPGLAIAQVCMAYSGGAHG